MTSKRLPAVILLLFSLIACWHLSANSVQAAAIICGGGGAAASSMAIDVAAKQSTDADDAATTAPPPKQGGSAAIEVNQFLQRVQCTLEKAKPWVVELEKEAKRLEETAKRVGVGIISRFSDLMESLLGHRGGSVGGGGGGGGGNGVGNSNSNPVDIETLGDTVDVKNCKDSKTTTTTTTSTTVAATASTTERAYATEGVSSENEADNEIVTGDEALL